MRDALNTIAGMLTNDGMHAQSLPWGELRYSHTAALRAKLADQYAPATANKILAALRGVLREAWRLGLMSAEDFHRAIDLTPIKSSTLPTGRALASTEVAALFDSCAKDDSPAGRRDAAMLAILYGSGLRRSEIVALDINDYDAVTGQLIVRGKGQKERTAYAVNGNKAILDEWIATRGASQAEPLFVPVNKAGRVIPERMGDHAVWKALAKRAKASGVTKVTPHDMRRTFCSTLLDRGADVSTVQRMMGHSSIQTTTRYDCRGEDAKMQAAALLSAPVASAEDAAL